MFKVKNKKTGEIVQVLDTYCDEYGGTWFLMWLNYGWRWRAANDFVPPNCEPKISLIVAGSRNFQNYPLMCKELDKIKSTIGEVICGDVKGADTYGAMYARDNNIPIRHCPADWEKYGVRAGYVRNEQMGNCADELIAFWDGISPGTKHMIDYMNSLKKKVTVIRFDQQGTV